jgi:hypothetical protein
MTLIIPFAPFRARNLDHSGDFHQTQTASIKPTVSSCLSNAWIIELALSQLVSTPRGMRDIF